MKDIQTREDILFLMEKFYNRLLSDPEISFLFIEVAQINLKEHLPILADFWEQVLFHKGGYRRNTLQIHLDLHHKSPLTLQHFQIWLSHFNKTLDENFSGEMAEKMKTRALSVATVMQLKMH